MRKGEKRFAKPAVMPAGGKIELPPDFYENRGRPHILPHKPSLPRPAVMPRKPRFEKGSQEAKDFMASIRNKKKGSGFFNNLGKSIKKEANKGKRAVFEKRIGDEANVVLPIAGTIIGGTAGTMAGVAFGGAVGSTAGGYAGKEWAKDINKRGYGMKGGKGRKGAMVKPASDIPTFSPYATLYSPQYHPFTPQSSFKNGGSGERIM